MTIQDNAPPQFSSIAAAANGYVASSDKPGGSSLMYSADGDTWYASAISVGDGFALTVNTYQYGFVAVGTNAARGDQLFAAWTSPDGRTWTLRADWKLPPNVTSLFGLGKGLVATSTVTPGAVAPLPHRSLPVPGQVAHPGTDEGREGDTEAEPNAGPQAVYAVVVVRHGSDVGSRRRSRPRA